MEIRSLNNICLNELFEAFEQAFADYEVQLNKVELLTMLKRRGFEPKASFGAFDGNKIVSFTCNGIGNFCLRYWDRNTERLPGKRVGYAGF